eukprot:2393691-Pleurochrysis_carterae.AAC.1
MGALSDAGDGREVEMGIGERSHMRGDGFSDQEIQVGRIRGVRCRRPAVAVAVAAHKLAVR